MGKYQSKRSLPFPSMHIFLGFEGVPVMGRIFVPTLQQASTAHFPNLTTCKSIGTSRRCCYLYVFLPLTIQHWTKLIGLKDLHGGARQPDSREQIFAPTNQPDSQGPPPPSHLLYLCTSLNCYYLYVFFAFDHPTMHIAI